eukprot:CAMPEP_0185845104 /NCGR_PEP_ID=MMETSP1354-20130828/1163_1 /TAXON_ID=708628 /ORGANISM="Erythrolobus madagascarensis, Strain CCMP3276" /LENGTH=36 /DNA_ID= /DNA_START= /DNA_END= /DNA_ORIENTATION=
MTSQNRGLLARANAPKPRCAISTRCSNHRAVGGEAD